MTRHHTDKRRGHGWLGCLVVAVSCWALALLLAACGSGDADLPKPPEDDDPQGSETGRPGDDQRPGGATTIPYQPPPARETPPNNQNPNSDATITSVAKTPLTELNTRAELRPVCQEYMQVRPRGRLDYCADGSAPGSDGLCSDSGTSALTIDFSRYSESHCQAMLRSIPFACPVTVEEFLACARAQKTAIESTTSGLPTTDLPECRTLFGQQYGVALGGAR